MTSLPHHLAAPCRPRRPLAECAAFLFGGAVYLGVLAAIFVL